jgi:hypothetical protein
VNVKLESERGSHRTSWVPVFPFCKRGLELLVLDQLRSLFVNFIHDCANFGSYMSEKEEMARTSVCAVESFGDESYLVDPASSHMLVSKIKPCMSKYKHLYTVKLRTAHYISNYLFDGTLLHG